jgi:enhancer of polycomb-like protein
MPPSVGIPQPQPRISSDGGMCPSTSPVVSSMSSNPPPTQLSPPQMPPPPVLQPTNGVNGANCSSSRASEGETVKLEAPSDPMANVTVRNQPDTNAQVVDHRVSVPVQLPLESDSPVRPKSSQNQHTVPMHNDYHIASMNGFPAMPNGSPYTHLPNGQHNGLSMQQMQNLKSVLANAQLQPDRI